jgi:hypothetical protein
LSKLTVYVSADIYGKGKIEGKQRKRELFHLMGRVNKRGMNAKSETMCASMRMCRSGGREEDEEEDSE